MEVLSCQHRQLEVPWFEGRDLAGVARTDPIEGKGGYVGYDGESLWRRGRAGTWGSYAALCTAPSYEQFVISEGYLQPEQPNLTA